MSARPVAVVAVAFALGAGRLAAQVPDTSAMTPVQRAALRVASLQLTATGKRVTVGDTVAFGDLVTVAAVDSGGRPVADARVIYNPPEGIVVLVGPDRLAATKPGRGELRAIVLKPPVPGQGAQFVTATVPFEVHDFPPTRVEITVPQGYLYAGTTIPYSARAYVASGRQSDVAEITWTSSNPRVAAVDRFGAVTGLAPGTATISARSGTAAATRKVAVRPNTIAELRLTGAVDKARTGDVVHYRVTALAAAGKPVPGVVPVWSATSPQNGDDLNARVWPDGAFVAEQPGSYTVVASAGNRAVRSAIQIEPRNVGRPVRLVGRALQTDHGSTDVHVWTAKDGRDSAYMGISSAGVRESVTGNVMLVYDVTDPAKPTLTDSVIVNARATNDVLVNEEGTIGALTREGASTRRNGLVLLDVANPAHPTVLSELTDSLTGGIHNTWFYQHVVYVTNDGTGALHIIDISNPKQPHQVGRWETGDPNNRYLHDVWVHDGIMYLSYWDDGVQILDVGGLHRGGTAEKPVFVSKFVYPTGSTHNVWRDRNYLFVGDEIFGCPQCINGPRGYVHVVDLSDIDHPVEVGKFEVPEAGTHNMWAEDGKLYIAYYQGGLRVVDITGELRGDLYRQGRQIGYFHTADEKGFRPNSPMAWAPQPHKGNIFVSDINSGLWVLKLDEKGPLIP